MASYRDSYDPAFATPPDFRSLRFSRSNDELVSHQSLNSLSVPSFLTSLVFYSIGCRVNGGPLPSKRGPIARFTSRALHRLRSTMNTHHLTSGKALEGKEADERASRSTSAFLRFELTSLTPCFRRQRTLLQRARLRSSL